MVGKAFAGLGALNSALDIARGLRAINDAARRNAAVIELQEKNLSAQSAQFALIDEIAALQKEIARLKAGNADK